MLHGILGMAIKLSSPVYYYVYDHLNQMSFNLLFGPCSKNLGVSHSDEMISLFTMNGLPELVGADLKISKLMVDIWTAFGTSEYISMVLINWWIRVIIVTLINHCCYIFSSLTIDGQNSGTKWPLFNINDMEYVLINSSNPIISKKPYLDEFEFWDCLPLLSKFTKMWILIMKKNVLVRWISLKYVKSISILNCLKIVIRKSV